MLTKSNLKLYAAQHYYNPKYLDVTEFERDLARFVYVRRSLGRYLKTDIINDRAMLNHLIVLFNVFSHDCAMDILRLYLDEAAQWKVLNAFLLFLNKIVEDTCADFDAAMLARLRKRA